MPERERWDIEALSKSLKAEAVPHHDPERGEGLRLTVRGARTPGVSYLDLYPATNRIHYHNSLAQLELGDVSAIYPQAGLLRIAAADDANIAMLFLYPNRTFAVNGLVFDGSPKESP